MEDLVTAGMLVALGMGGVLTLVLIKAAETAATPVDDPASSRFAALIPAVIALAVLAVLWLARMR